MGIEGALSPFLFLHKLEVPILDSGLTFQYHGKFSTTDSITMCIEIHPISKKVKVSKGSKDPL